MNPESQIAVIGGGPAGLMAALVLSEAGHPVHLYDAMPSVGRKFLLAGKGGLNLTHSEELDSFLRRYGKRQAEMDAIIRDFPPDDLRDWAQGLGVDTFVGTSGRVFPKEMKAAPLLRAWLQLLRHPKSGTAVQFHTRHRWQGWDDDGALVFETPQGPLYVNARATILALGGGSWAKLGSDGTWVSLLAGRGVEVAPLLPSNCGFDVAGGWSEHFAVRFAGQPLKAVAIRFTDSTGNSFSRKGEFVVTATGVEGSLIYAASTWLRDAILSNGSVTLELDLLPDLPFERVSEELLRPRGSLSFSNHMRKRLRIDGVKAGILREGLSQEAYAEPVLLAGAIKALPITLSATRPLDEAISSAGGVRFGELTAGLMLERLPGVFCAGEMLDWEAPTGGYLLQACFASGRKAGLGVCDYVRGLAKLPKA
jgi:uncharacterized flavoprotein (TIGR03862 family)